MSNLYIPVCKADLKERGIEEVDFVFVSGDGYVDHPSVLLFYVDFWKPMVIL